MRVPPWEDGGVFIAGLSTADPVKQPTSRFRAPRWGAENKWTSNPGALPVAEIGILRTAVKQLGSIAACPYSDKENAADD